MNMNIIVLASTILTLAIASCGYNNQYQGISNSHFDDNTPPPVELKKLDALVGYWEGTGEIFDEPNAEAKPWASKVYNEKVFGDHYLQMIEHKHFGSENTLSTFGYISWDWGDQQYKKMFVSNARSGSIFETMYLINENTFLQQLSNIDNKGRVILDQVITNINADSYTVVINRSIDGGALFIHLNGTYKRTNEANMPKGIESLKSVNSFIPITDGSRWLANMMSGKYKAIATVDKYKFNVDETSTPILGGNAVVTDYFFEGDDGFTGYNVMTWNEEKNRITGFMLDNRGVAVKFEAVPNAEKNQVIVALKTILANTAQVERWIWDVDEKRGMIKSMTHVIHGSNAPIKKITFDFEREENFEDIKG